MPGQRSLLNLDAFGFSLLRVHLTSEDDREDDREDELFEDSPNMRGSSLHLADELIICLVRAVLGANLIQLPFPSSLSRPLIGSLTGLPKRVKLSLRCLMVASNSSIGVNWPMMCVCKPIGCNARS